jgi:hypothetical protein
MLITTELPKRGTTADLIWAAELGARLAARKGRSKGLDDQTIRDQVVRRIRSEFIADADEYPVEMLVEAAERGVSEVLSAPRFGGYGSGPMN